MIHRVWIVPSVLGRKTLSISAKHGLYTVGIELLSGLSLIRLGKNPNAHCVSESNVSTAHHSKL